MAEVRTKSRFPQFISEVREHWLTLDETADAYGLSRRYVRSLQENRRIEVFRLEGKYRVNPDSIEAFLESQHQVP